MNNDARIKLCDLIAKYGKSVCEDPRRCEGLLKDFLGEHRKEINLLVLALKEKVVENLMNSAGKAIPIEIVLGGLIKRLQDNFGLAQQAAHWSVESWAVALGCVTSSHEQPASVLENERDRSLLLLVPQGKFLAGGPGAHEGAGPFPVELPPYYLGMYPVSNVQYAEFLNEQKPDDAELANWIDFDNDCFVRKSGRGYEAYGGKEDHPVVQVSWYGAESYAKWAGLHLPAELQWEKGARGVDGREYPWGNEWDVSRCRNYMNRGTEKTCGVQEYASGCSIWGHYQMSGNVWEWCADWYEKEAYSRYSEGDLRPSLSGMSRVVRGGSWYSAFKGNFRGAYRSDFPPDRRLRNVGFRLAATPTP